MVIENDVTEELFNWGWWAQGCPTRELSFKKTSGVGVSKLGEQPDITEERALEIDQAIAKLFSSDEQAVKVIKWRFVCGLSYRDIAKQMRKSAPVAQRTIDSYVAYLSGYLYKNT